MYMAQSIKSYYAIPLHISLSRYESALRYLDAKQPPVKDLATLRTSIEAVKHLIKVVELTIKQ